MSEDVRLIIDELADLFAEAEFEGGDRITLVSMVGSRFHERVKRALWDLQKSDDQR